MVIAGMMQYLAQVQEIPKYIEKALSKRAVKFMWAGRSPLVNKKTLFCLLDNGGWALVDIKSQDKAIGVMWLKSYFSFSPNHPIWALVADGLMTINVPKTEEKVNNRVKISPFLQSWRSRASAKGETYRDIL